MLDVCSGQVVVSTPAIDDTELHHQDMDRAGRCIRNHPLHSIVHRSLDRLSLVLLSSAPLTPCNSSTPYVGLHRVRTIEYLTPLLHVSACLGVCGRRVPQGGEPAGQDGRGRGVAGRQHPRLQGRSFLYSNSRLRGLFKHGVRRWFKYGLRRLSAAASGPVKFQSRVAQSAVAPSNPSLPLSFPHRARTWRACWVCSTTPRSWACATPWRRARCPSCPSTAPAWPTPPASSPSLAQTWPRPSRYALTMCSLYIYIYNFRFAFTMCSLHGIQITPFHLLLPSLTPSLPLSVFFPSPSAPFPNPPPSSVSPRQFIFVSTTAAAARVSHPRLLVLARKRSTARFVQTYIDLGTRTSPLQAIKKYFIQHASEKHLIPTRLSLVLLRIRHTCPQPTSPLSTLFSPRSPLLLSNRRGCGDGQRSHHGALRAPVHGGARTPQRAGAQGRPLRRRVGRHQEGIHTYI